MLGNTLSSVDSIAGMGWNHPLRESQENQPWKLDWIVYFFGAPLRIFQSFPRSCDDQGCDDQAMLTLAEQLEAVEGAHPFSKISPLKSRKSGRFFLPKFTLPRLCFFCNSGTRSPEWLERIFGWKKSIKTETSWNWFRGAVLCGIPGVFLHQRSPEQFSWLLGEFLFSFVVKWCEGAYVGSTPHPVTVYKHVKTVYSISWRGQY